MESLNFCTELTYDEAISVVGGATSSDSSNSKTGFSKALAKYKSTATGNVASASGGTTTATSPSNSSSKSNAQASSGIVIGS